MLNLHSCAPLLGALALALCGCSGGGGGGSSVSFSFSTAVLGVSEDDGDVALEIVLDGATFGLEADASVVVSDAGTGTATVGVDYAPFASRTVTFPAGSVDGDVQTVVLSLLDDATVEGDDETVRLALSSPQGAGLTSPDTLTVAIADAQEATIRFVSGLSATVDETTQSYPVTVRLALGAGVTLGLDVSIQVADTGAGTATSGADYAAFAARTLTFSAGSSSGSAQTVDVDVIDDSLIEGDESVRLWLSQASTGAKVGGLSTHQLTIRDDDYGSAAFLSASEGPTGVENPLAYDAQLDLGSQSVGAGPNAGTLLRLTNLGQAPLALGAPELSGNHPDDFAVEIESISAPPPAAGAEPPVLGLDLPVPLAAVTEDPRLGVSALLDTASLAGLASLPSVTLHGFPLPERGEVTLLLRRLPLPLAPDAVLAVDGVVQPGGPRALLEGLSLWRGTILELPGSHAFLALGPGGASGYLELPHTPDRIVHVLTEAAPAGTAAVPRLRVAREWQLEALGFEPPPVTCAGALEVAGLPPAPTAAASPGSAKLTAADCRIAVETDYQLYQKFNSVPGTTSYVTQLIAAVSDRYLTDVQTTLSIAYLGVYSTSADPWTTQDAGGNASALLTEFRNAWNASGWPAAADLAHFVSGAGLGGGVAYVNVLCSQSFGYGVSGNINGNVNWGSWTGQPGSFTWDFVVVAHELGHNFGTNHTHAYCPPLDQCASNCNGSTTCSEGTIMSYCHTCSGGMNNIRLEFHPVVADVMRAAVNSSCLGQSALAGGDWVQYLVRFNPLGATGSRSATLQLDHDATNHPSPFRLQLSGDATN